MRNYFNPRSSGSRSMKTPVQSKDLHWGAFAALVSGCKSFLSSYDLRLLQASYSFKDVSLVMMAISRLDQNLTEYDSATDVALIRAHRYLVGFLKKFPFTQDESPFDTRLAATSKWKQAEDQCRLTNERLGLVSRETTPSWVTRARQIVSDVLGDLTPEKVMSIISSGAHGPGATLTSNGDKTTPYYKFMDLPYSVSASARPYAYAAISSNPRWIDLLENSGRRTRLPKYDAPQYQKELMLLDDCCEVEDSDRITFVPKDARTERPIAVGASMNMFLQLGVKAYMEERLIEHGVNLTDQSRNRRLAYEGSRYSMMGGIKNSSQFATIDLASASDTISIEIVRLLLDSEWFAFLDDLRHKTGSFGEEHVVYNKFSAMGNGFTFPLESLIFFAVAKAAALEAGHPCQRKDIAVYGDDIIVREYAARDVILALNWAGFSVNTEKSFLEGRFKESCGADYYSGHPVRPFYLKRRIETYEDLYFIGNSISDIVKSHGAHPALTELYSFVVNNIPVRHRRYTPLVTTSDCGLRVPLDYLDSAGLRPFLDQAEIHSLVKHRQLAEKNSQLSASTPFFWDETPIAKVFSGRGYGKLFLSLHYKPRFHRHMKTEDVLHLEAASSGTVTRRNAVRYVMQARPCSNWNAEWSSHEIKRHPIYNHKL
uniref:RNA-directed RNA polymerase n=1 Tax=Wenling levi-like virus 3 TaxID=1923499 RepID=A0A1L3KIX7_9VIRU|nr:hypothetical protein [Wenling levi-like virus 3]